MTLMSFKCFWYDVFRSIIACLNPWGAGSSRQPKEHRSTLNTSYLLDRMDDVMAQNFNVETILKITDHEKAIEKQGRILKELQLQHQKMEVVKEKMIRNDSLQDTQ